MPLSKVNRPGLNTGVTDNSDATAVVIDSSERVGVGVTPNATFGSHLYVQGTPAANKPILSVYSQGNSNNAGIAILNDAGNKGIWTESGNLRFTSTYEGNSTTQMNIDSGGRVTMPNQVAFAAYRNSSNNNTTNENPVQYETEIFDIGGNYNTTSDRFTAPVSGKYFISASLGFYKNGDVRAVEFYLRRNGNYYMRCDSFVQQTQGNNTHNQATIAVLISLSANDYVDLYMNATASINIYASTKNNQFCGFLVA